MGTVANLDERRPHTAGGARCMNCGETWTAVIPTGTAVVECPNCHCFRGYRDGLVVPSDKHATFRCLRCVDEKGATNDLMIILGCGDVMCAGCGFRHSWEIVFSGST